MTSTINGRTFGQIRDAVWRDRTTLSRDAKSFQKRKPVRMNGLRIYIDVVRLGIHSGFTVFYSRRAGGPFYRWSYEEKLEQWRCYRMHISDVMPSELSVATWKGVPAGLQAKLNEHYLE